MATGKAAEVVVELQVAGDAGNVPDADAIRSWVTATLEHIGRTDVAEVSVRVVGEAEGRQLNDAWRGRGYATNVLSFPAAADDLPDEVPRSLGDIVICAPVVEREAAEQGKPVTHHWAHLVVHGALHLAGYDHEEAASAEAMEAIETEILRQGDIPDPYVV